MATLRPAAKPSADDTPVVQDRGVKEVAEQLSPLMNAIGRHLDKVDDLFFALIGLIQKFLALIAPYHPEELLPALYGLLLLFFGGTFMTTLAAIEAVHNFGWEKIKNALIALYNNYEVARAAIKKDNAIDEDNDGQMDVDEITKQELAARRALVIAKAIDPAQVAAALEGLTQAWIAVIATLRVKFAHAITIGVSIGQVVHDIIEPVIAPLAMRVVPRDYHKWIPVVVKYSCRYCGVSIAWFVERIVNSAFCSMKGSKLFFVGLLHYLIRRSYVQKDKFDLGTPLFTLVFTVVAFFGFWFQLSRFFRLPFPLNILLFPITVVERLLMFYVAVKDK